MKCLVLFLLVWIAMPTTSYPQTRYTVRVPDDPRMVHVSGSFELGSDMIGMYITSSPQLEGGQANLVRNLEVTRAGQPVELDYVGGGDWRLARVEAGEWIELQYDVLTEHDQYEWGPGIDEVAYRQDDGLFFTGFSLFIVDTGSAGNGSDAGDAAVDLRFELPDAWRVSSPWPVDEDHLHHPSSTMDLLRNCFFMGTHFEESITIGEFTFLVAIGGGLAQQKQLFVDFMRPLLPAYVETFGGMPSATRYLAVINPGSRSDGGAFTSSYSMLISGEANEASSAVWGHGIAHELLHFWNGHTLVPANASDEEWFKEGFTDYLTLIHLSRAGLDDPQITLRKLENMMRRYVVAKRLMGSTDSMRAAGAEKHRNRFLVYGGGALMGFALDVRIREATGNAVGLDGFMRALYGEFGSPELRYTFEDIVRVASEVSGEDQSGFLARFVDGTEFLDAGPYFEAIGMQVVTFGDEFYLAFREDADGSQRAMARSILGL